MKLAIKKYEEINYGLTVEWLNDKFIQETFGLTYNVELAAHKTWVMNNPQVEFLALYADDQYVGNIVLTLNRRHLSTCLQIYIGSSAHRGKGLGKGFMKLALEHCFSVLKLNRVWLDVREYNQAAIRLYQSLNFKNEGTEREVILVEGKFLNQVRMSLLKSEYHAGEA